MAVSFPAFGPPPQAPPQQPDPKSLMLTRPEVPGGPPKPPQVPVPPAAQQPDPASLKLTRDADPDHVEREGSLPEKVIQRMVTFGGRQIPIEQAKAASGVIFPTAGAIAGATRGGGVGGAGIGATLGEQLAMGAETAMGAPPTFQEWLQRSLSAPATGMVAEAGGQVAGKVVGKVAAPFSKKLGAVGREAVEYLKGKVMPSQVADSHILSSLENITRGSIFGGGRIRKFYEQQADLLKTKADEILGQFGPRVTREEAGRLVNTELAQQFGRDQAKILQGAEATGTQAAAHAEQAGQLQTGLQSRFGPPKTLEETGKAWQALQAEAKARATAVGNELFSEVDRLAKKGGEVVPLDRMVQLAEAHDASVPAMAQALTGKAGQLPAVVQRTGVETIPSNQPGAEAGIRKSLGLPESGDVGGTAGQLLQRILTVAGITPEQVQARILTFTQARNVRSAIGEVLGDAMRSGDTRLKGIASQFFKTLDEDMELAAGGPDSELGKTFRSANAAWKYMRETFDEGLLQKVADAEPRMIVDMLIKPGRVDEIARTRKAVGEDAWRQVAAAHLNRLLTDEKTGLAVGAKELRKRLTALKPETIQAVYGAGSAEDLAKLQASLFSAEELGAQSAAAKAGALKPQFTPTADHEIVSSIIQPGAVEPIEKMRAIVGDDVWKAVQSAKAAEILDEGGKLVDGATLLKRLNKLTPETLKAAYPRGVDEGFWQLGRVMERIQRKQPGTGSMYIQLAQGSVATGILLGGGSYQTAGAILLGPAMLSRIMVNPLARRWLTTGLLQGSGMQAVTTEGARAASNLMAFLVREGLLPSSGRSGAPPSAPVTTSGRSGGPGVPASSPATPSTTRGGGPPGPPGPPPGPRR